MNFKTTYILFGILGGLLVIFGIVLWLNPLPPENEDHVLPSLHAATNPIKSSEVTEVVVQRNRPKEEKWVFVKDEKSGQWAITEPRAMRADQTAINGLINQVFEARRDRLADKPTRRDAVGLEPPAEVVTLKLKNDKTVKLEVGETTPGTTSAVTYVVSSDLPKEIIAVPKSQLDDLEKGLANYRARNPLTSREGDIQSVTLVEQSDSKDKAAPVELEKRNGQWYYVKPFTGEVERDGDNAAPPAGTAVSAPSSMQNLLNDLTNLRVDYKSDKDNDFVADDVSDKDLGKYNLGDKADVLKVQVKLIDEIDRTRDKEDKEAKKEVKTSTVTLLIGVGKKTDDKDAANAKYYARRADEKDVVKVSAKNVDPLLKLVQQPDALRDRHLVRLEAGKQPDAINIKNSHGLLEFRQPDSLKPWELWAGDVQHKVNEQAVKSLITQLTERQKDMEFLPPTTKDSEVGLSDPAAVVSLWVGGIGKDEKKDEKKEEKKDEKAEEKKDDKKDKDEKPAEKKDEKKDEKKEDKKEEKKEDKPAKPKLKAPEKPLVKLTFAKPTDRMAKNVVVKREGEGLETTLMRVPVAIYDRVIEGPLAYLDKTLPQYNPGALDATKDVTRLMYQEGGNVTELSREKAEGPWKYVKPEALAGRTADPQSVSAILEDLNRLTAVKLVAEKASPEDLDRKYGLKNPSSKAVVTVTRDGKSTTYEFDFGKDEGNDVYAKQSQRDTIFLVDRFIVSRFKQDLLDRTVFKFDVSKVKSVKLTGWSKLTGSPLTLEVEKDGSNWTVKAPKDFKLDPKKIDALLNSLSNLRAERFVAHGAKPKPEQELEVNQGALKIEVVVEGEKKPLVLTLGKLEADGYLATSDTLPGDVFVVTKAPFEGPASKPAFFNP